MSLRAVLFDAAGTLFRVRGSVGLAYATVAARHGVVVPAVQLETRFRAAFRAMPPMCFPGAPEFELPGRERAWWKQVVANAFAGSVFDDFGAFFEDLFAYFARTEGWELFPDTRPALAALKARRLRLGVVSNFDGRLQQICEGFGIAAAFDTIVMSGRVGYAKPDPRIFALALARLGVTATEAVHVGDSESEDIEGARGAGLRAVIIERASSARSADDRIHDLTALLSRL